MLSFGSYLKGYDFKN